jgi:hypothetical protein
VIDVTPYLIIAAVLAVFLIVILLRIFSIADALERIEAGVGNIESEFNPARRTGRGL